VSSSKPFGSGDELLGVHLADQARADFLVELDEDVAFELRIDEVPHDLALGRRQGLQQRCHFRRVHRVHQAVHLAHRALVERAPEGLEVRWSALVELCVHRAQSYANRPKIVVSGKWRVVSEHRTGHSG